MIRGSRATALVVGALALGGLALPAAASSSTPPTESVAVVTADGAEMVEVTPVERAQLEAGPAVVVPRGTTVQTELAQSVPKVGAPTLWAEGTRGAGQVVVVIDTGVISGFGGTLAGQACIAANQQGTIGYCGTTGGLLEAYDSTCFDLGVCGIGDAFDPEAGRPCGDEPVVQACSHGSAVAAVAARHDPPAGVAPDAGVYSIQVFDPVGGRADLVDLLLALDHAADLAEAGLDVAAINLSVSTSDLYNGTCDGIGSRELAFKAAFDRLLSLGIPAAVASGNDGQKQGIGFPACVSSAVSVGASTVADGFATFGNRGPGLDFLAPGTRTGATGLSIPSGTAFSSWKGTSFSAPHVAGAFVLLAEAYPRADTEQRAWIARAGSTRLTEYIRLDPDVERLSPRSYNRLGLAAAPQVLNGRAFVPLGRVTGGGAQGVTGDFDGDGVADVFTYTPGSTPDRVTYGGPSWAPASKPISLSYSYVALGGQFVGAANGPDDVLLYGPGGAVDKLWAGNPDRTFSSLPASLPTAGYPVVGDFDGDGWDDVLIAAPGATDQLRYGGVAGLSAPVTLPVSSDAASVALDVDGDGQDELVHHRPGRAPDRIWAFTTRTTFTSTVIDLGPWTGISALPIAADLDGNGGEDLILARSDGFAIRVRPVGGAFGSAIKAPYGGVGSPAVGDVDANGTDDIVWVKAGSATDWLWYGLYSGSVSTAAMAISGSYHPILTDLDDSHGADLVLVAPGSTMNAWWAWR